MLLPIAWLLYPTAVVWGAAGAAANVLVISARQRLIPAELLGRVNSAYRLIGMGGMPIGAVLGGVLGEFAGLPAVLPQRRGRLLGRCRPPVACRTRSNFIASDQRRFDSRHIQITFGTQRPALR